MLTHVPRLAAWVTLAPQSIERVADELRDAAPIPLLPEITSHAAYRLLDPLVRQVPRGLPHPDARPPSMTIPSQTNQMMRPSALTANRPAEVVKT